MQADKKVPMLYKRSEKELPTLYICPVENVLGRVPLIPCYMKGNTHPTIPYCLRRMDLGEQQQIQEKIMDREQAV
jgi:hypothetical protein